MPATAMPWLASTPAPTAASIRPRTSVASASISPAVGGSPPKQRSVWRTTPAWSESWKEISRPVPTTSSVEPPPMSTTRVGSVGRRLRGGAEVGGAGLLLAVEDAGREREALAQLGDEGAAVVGVADGAGRDRVDRLGAQLLEDADIAADRLADVLDRLGREAAGEVDAPAQPGHGAAPIERRDPPPGHVRHQQPRRVGPDVDHRDPLSPVSHPATLETAAAAKTPAQIPLQQPNPAPPRCPHC